MAPITATRTGCARSRFWSRARSSFKPAGSASSKSFRPGFAASSAATPGTRARVTNVLAAAAEFVVTHPNAVNASELNEMAENVYYVEGKSLDDFLLGHLALLPVPGNRIGTFIDPTGARYADDVVHALNAARAVKGIDCELYGFLRDELGIEIGWSDTGCARSGPCFAPKRYWTLRRPCWRTESMRWEAYRSFTA